MTYQTPAAVAGQGPLGRIDAFSRDNPADGTLGIPDFSPIAYTYAPLIEPTGTAASWAISTWTTPSSVVVRGASKVDPNGMGFVRSVGPTNNGTMRLKVALQTNGTTPTPPNTNRTPDNVWGSSDLVITLRNDGLSSWIAPTARAYLAFTKRQQFARIHMTTYSSSAPWNAWPSDAGGIGLSAHVNLWDGEVHTIMASVSGSMVFALIDEKWPCVFNNPHCYNYSTGSAGYSSHLPSSGTFMGVDMRGSNQVSSLGVMLPPTYDPFWWNPTSGTVDAAPSGTYTPGTLPSGESWALTGTVSGSASGASLSASSSMITQAAWRNGWLCGQFSSAGPNTQLIFRRTDASNYLYLLPDGTVHKVVSGTATQIGSLGALGTTSSFTLRFNDSTLAAFTGYSTTTGDLAGLTSGVSLSGVSTGKGIGVSTAAGESAVLQYLYFQPDVTTPVVPTS